jgi:CheY-like chemotaxis protein
MDTSLSVLIADDDDNDALLLQRAFKHNGLHRPAHIVQDGGEAIRYLQGDGPYADRVAHPFPNIVILDLKMPGVSGFDVLDWLNKNPDYRVIPTIVWSASADRRDVKHAFCLGAHAYLCKPVDYHQFDGMVARLLAFWNDCERPGVEPGDPSCDTLKESHPFAGAQSG